MSELLHHPGRKYESNFSFTSPKTVAHHNLVERIMAAYRREHLLDVEYGTSIWKGIDELRSRASDTLMTGSPEDVEAMLRAPAASNILFGFENTYADYNAGLRLDPSRQLHEARWIHDALARLAEALGAVSCAGPEAPHLDQTLDVSTLVARIAQQHGASLDFPNPFADEFGIDTPAGVASLRSVHAIYQAFRVRDLLKLSRGGTVLEIGAGLGRTAYYCVKCFGLRYLIYDLPLTNVVQAYFLGVTLGEDRIALSGETFDPVRHSVRLASVNERLGPQMECDVLLNVDSMTELDINMAEGYVDFALKHASAFLTINHEGQAFRVNDLLTKRGVPVLRFPYWMRKGYVEEISFGYDPNPRQRHQPTQH